MSKFLDFTPIVTNDKEKIGERCPMKLDRREKNFPFISSVVLLLIILGCLFADLITSANPNYMDLSVMGIAPTKSHLFGTDMLGRDIFSMIWHGGRISLFIGILSAAFSFVIALVYGSASALSSKGIDSVMMRAIEIFVSIPTLLLIVLVQAAMGGATIFTLSVVIGVTSWMEMAKVVRGEMLQIREREYILAAKAMGAGFFYMLRRHYLKNLIPSIMFMAVTNVSIAITAEATLSFLGIGLSIETVSWGSMLAEAQRALLSNKWWIIIIPGVFLIAAILSITNLGNYVRKNGNKRIKKI